MKTPFPLAVGVLLAAFALTACGTENATTVPPSSSHSTTPTAPDVVVTSPTSGGSASPTPGSALTCETLTSPATVEALKEQGWTYEQRELQIGDVVVEGGLECMWGDYSTGSDHGQIYAWGPLTPERARTAQAGLQSDGWIRSSEDGKTYFTEDPDYAIATDEDGFGMTYEFGDGWVKFADTKQGLLLIEASN